MNLTVVSLLHTHVHNAYTDSLHPHTNTSTMTLKVFTLPEVTLCKSCLLVALLIIIDKEQGRAAIKAA